MAVVSVALRDVFTSNLSPFIVLVLILTYILYKFEKRNGKRKENGPESLPGPKNYDPTGILGNLFQIMPPSQTATLAQRISLDYGDIFKLTFFRNTLVVLNSGPVAQQLLQSPDLGHIEKNIFYDFMKPYMSKGLLVSSGEFWQNQRKILMRSQSFQNLKGFIPMLNKHSKMFVDELEKKADGELHQVNGLINSAFIEIISEMVTGFDQEESKEAAEYHHNFKIWKEAFITRVSKPWLLLKPIWKIHPLSKRHDKAVNGMFEFAKRRITEHKKRKENKQFRSVLDELIDAGVNEDQIVEEINTIIFGGHETGAGVIHCLLFCIASIPEIQLECQHEIDELFDSLDDDFITYEQATGGLKYLERCILETMRLFPPAFVIFRKLISELKINHNGQEYILPPGTNTLISPFLMHRKPELFPDPLKFDPDRFLPEEIIKRHSHSYIPFSAGQRNCLGLKFAMIEMKIVAAHIIRNFSIDTFDKFEDITLVPAVTLTPEKDFNFQFKRRNLN